MSTAQQLLITYGVGILGFGFLLGIPLAAVRSKSPVASRSLITTHLSALIQGPIHLALAGAVGATGFDSTAATVGAILLLVGSGLEALGSTANWLQKVGDQFAARSPGFRMNALSAPVSIAGLTVLAVGIITRL